MTTVCLQVLYDICVTYYGIRISYLMANLLYSPSCSETRFAILNLGAILGEMQ